MQKGPRGLPVTLEVEGPVPVLPVAGVLPVPEVTGVDTPGAEGGRPAPTPVWAPIQAFWQTLGCHLSCTLGDCCGWRTCAGARIDISPHPLIL